VAVGEINLVSGSVKSKADCLIRFGVLKVVGDQGDYRAGPLKCLSAGIGVRSIAPKYVLAGDSSKIVFNA
jgi:hypothetical protein